MKSPAWCVRRALSIFSPSVSQVRSALDGYNVCIFAYGQTGSGKTHTILGTPTAPGLLPRAMEQLYPPCLEGPLEVAVECSMLELYQDTLGDLLGPAAPRTPPRPGSSPGPAAEATAPRLEIKRGPTGEVRVEGSTFMQCGSLEELRRQCERGMERRQTAVTRMNDASSRSHLVFSIHICTKNTATGVLTRSKLTFVDLAGSERVARSGAIDDATRLKEAQAINKSLSALGDVVSALTTGADFVPYRNHKLTQLMSDSLGGNAKTLMVVNVSPLISDVPESKNSLEYATRVKNVANEASKSVETRELSRLRAVVERQAGELAALRGGRP